MANCYICGKKVNLFTGCKFKKSGMVLNSNEKNELKDELLKHWAEESFCNGCLAMMHSLSGMKSTVEANQALER